jgi:hypothetical protein
MGRVKKDTGSKPETWSPGRTLFENPAFPKPADEAILAAANHLKITDEKRKSDFTEQVRFVARRYWELRQDVVGRPPAKWYRSKITALEKAAGDLLKLLQEPSGTAFSYLEFRMQRDMGRPLRYGGSAEQQSFEKLLEEFLATCKASKFEGKEGAKPHTHLKMICWGLAGIWSEFTDKKFPRSLETADDQKESIKSDVSPKKSFISPGPYFVQLMLEAIDPAVTTRQIISALKLKPLDE